MQRKRRRRGRSTPRDVELWIEERAAAGDSGPEIHRKMQDEEGFRGRIPSLRTVQNIRTALVKDPTEPWTLGEADDPDDAQYVLAALAEVVSQSAGRQRQITNAEAEWIIRLRLAAPDIPAWDAYVYARRYLGRESREESTAELDIAVAQTWGIGADARKAQVTANKVEAMKMTREGLEGFLEEADDEQA